MDGQNVNSVDISVNNVAQDRNNTFLLPITLWVYGKKVQTKGLVDSGATTNFISHRFVQTNHLVSNRLAHSIPVRNADGTTNSLGSIKYYVRALLQIGDHKTTQRFLVTDLGDKDVMIGYTYLHRHNPEIDWSNGDWEFTRCPDTCADKIRKSRYLKEADTDELLIPGYPFESSLDTLGTEDWDTLMRPKIVYARKGTPIFVFGDPRPRARPDVRRRS